MNFLNIFLLVINIASLICVVPFALFGIVEYFVRPEGAKKLLKKLKISWSYRCIMVVGFICLAILLITSLMREILF